MCSEWTRNSADKIAGMRDKLVTPSIGKSGQLEEWSRGQG
jgi:hypothetical protein